MANLTVTAEVIVVEVDVSATVVEQSVDFSLSPPEVTVTAEVIE